MISERVQEQVMAEQRKMLMRSMMAKRTPKAMHSHSSHSSDTPPNVVVQYTAPAIESKVVSILSDKMYRSVRFGKRYSESSPSLP